jgi:hypothetical protein
MVLSKRQPIAVHEDLVAFMCVLDAARALSRHAQLTFFADQYEDGAAERVLRCWAAANGVTLEERRHEYADSAIRALYGACGDGAQIVLLWPTEGRNAHSHIASASDTCSEWRAGGS